MAEATPITEEHEKAMADTDAYLKQRAAEEWAASGVQVPNAEPPQETEPKKEAEPEPEAKEEETKKEEEKPETEAKEEETKKKEAKPEEKPETEAKAEETKKKEAKPEEKPETEAKAEEETRSQRSRRRRDERIRAEAREEAKKELEAAAAKETEELRKQLASIRAKHQQEQGEGGDPPPPTKEPNIDDFDTVSEYYAALDAYEEAQRAAPPAPTPTEREPARHSDAPPTPKSPLAANKQEERPRIDLLADEFQAILEENDQGELVEDLIGLAQGGRLDLASEELLDDLLELDEEQVVRVATQIRDRPTRAGRLAGMARSARLSFLRKLSAPPKPKAETKPKPEPITPIRATPGSGSSPDPTVGEDGKIDTRAYLEMRRRETLGLNQ